MSAPDDSVARVAFPDKAAFLLTERARYKVLEGGRDAIKSWSVTRAALIRGAGLTMPPESTVISRPTRFLCCRELMTSVEESIYQLLVGQIELMRLGQFYEPKATHIFGRKGTSAWGTQFAFAGLRHNSDGLKSYEAFDIAIVEEAKNVSRRSWDDLVFTIRKAGSEIWVVFNPELEADETYQRFIVKPPPGAIVKHFTYRDNPWPSTVLAPEREQMRVERPDDYANIWEGRPRSSLIDAIYADELRKAETDGRICKVPYDATAAVHTFWDLAYGNHTSIWCAQRVGLEWRMLKFIENSNKFLPYYVAELQKLPYVWGTDFLPHDGAHHQLGADSIENQLKALNRDVVTLHQDDVTAGINAARNVFPFCWFDREGCADGLDCLRHYLWKKNSDGIVTSREALKNGYDDGADAFRTFAMARNKATSARRRVVAGSKPAQRRPAQPASGSWMGT